MNNYHIATTAYPIAHLKTMKDYRISDDEKQDFARKCWNGTQEL